MAKVYYEFVLLAAVTVMTLNVCLAQSGGGRGDPVRFSISAEVLGTDNRDSSPQKESNFDFFVRPRMEIISDTERTVFDFFYQPSLRHRSDPAPNQDENSFYHDLGVNLRYGLTPATTVRISDYYLFTDDPSSDPGGTTLRRESNYQINRAEGELSVQAGEVTMVQIGVDHTLRKYEEDDVAFQSDEEILNGQLVFARSLEETLSVFIKGAVSAVDYGTSSALNRGFTAVSGGVGVNSVFSEFARGSVDAGVTSLEYDDSNTSSDNVPYFGLGLEMSTAARTKLSLSGRYSLRDSDVFPYSSQKNTDLSARLEWKGTELITLGVWGAYRLGEYDGENVSESVLRSANVSSASQFMALRGYSATGEETTIVIGAEATYAVDEYTSIKLSQSYEDVDSDVDASFARNSTRLMLKRIF